MWFHAWKKNHVQFSADFRLSHSTQSFIWRDKKINDSQWYSLEKKIVSGNQNHISPWHCIAVSAFLEMLVSTCSNSHQWKARDVEFQKGAMGAAIKVTFWNYFCLCCLCPDLKTVTIFFAKNFPSVIKQRTQAILSGFG